MEEAGQGAAGRPVLEVELVLAEAVAGADGVDRHPDLHPEAGGEGQGRRAASRPAAPAGRRSAPSVSQPAEPPDRPAGEAEGEAEAAADPAREGGDREVALPRLDRLDQRRQARRRGAEVAVAEQDQPRRRLGAQRRLRRRASRWRPCRAGGRG